MNGEGTRRVDRNGKEPGEYMMNESDEGTERRVVSPVPSPLRVLRSSLTPSVVNRLPGSLCSSVSDDEPITVLSHRSTSAPPFLSRFFRLGSVPLHSRLITGGTK